MKKVPKRCTLVCNGTLAGALIAASTAYGQATDAQPQAARLDELRKLVEEQTERLEALKRAVAEQEARLQQVSKALGLEQLEAQRGGTAAAGAQPQQVAQTQPQQPVGQAPERKDTRPPEIAPIFEQPGVLTPRGKVVLEPSLQYSYSSTNRVALVGFTIIPAITIGIINVREVKRNTFTGALTARYGLTNRLEVEAKVPYVYRSDNAIAFPFNVPATQQGVFDATGKGIGDVEFTGRYQINEGGPDKPYYIGTLRFKTRTGKDPFEVETARIEVEPGFQGFNLQKELPTGSGFYGIQPGLTVLYPSDPAVFFGSVSYLHNFKRTGVTQKTDAGDEELGSIEAGDIFGFNFGMGLAINENSSFSIGYDHNSVGKTKQNGRTVEGSVRTQLGTLLLGYSYRINPTTALNVSVGAGVTRDTPDVQLTVRLPMTF